MKPNFFTKPRKPLARSGFKYKPTKPMRRTPLKTISPNKIKKPKAHNASWWQRKCDDLMQDINRLRYRTCEVCGRKNEVGHHVITKALSSYLRYNWLNLVHICHSCHFSHHIQSDPSILAKLIETRGKEWYDNLEKVRRTPQKTGIKYYQDIYTQLEKEKILLEKDLSTGI